MVAPTTERKIELFIDSRGVEPVSLWLNELHVDTRSRITNRILRLKHGNYGDYKRINKDIFELRLDFGPGYRVYCAEIKNTIVLILCGGDKKTQKRDVSKAIKYFQEYKESNNV